MLREFIAYTPHSDRCMCKTMELKTIEDHWIECPIGLEMKRARAVSEKEALRRSRVSKVVVHSASEVLKELSDVQFKGIEDRVKLESARRITVVSNFTLVIM